MHADKHADMHADKHADRRADKRTRAPPQHAAAQQMCTCSGARAVAGGDLLASTGMDACDESAIGAADPKECSSKEARTSDAAKRQSLKGLCRFS
eukprot:6176162-Pleurochrysis_carterae.AAC.1